MTAPKRPMFCVARVGVTRPYGRRILLLRSLSVGTASVDTYGQQRSDPRGWPYCFQPILLDHDALECDVEELLPPLRARALPRLDEVRPVWSEGWSLTRLRASDA